MKKNAIIAVVFLLGLFSGTVWAKELKIDHNHSEIRFEVQHIFSTVSGRFTGFEADVFFDPDHLEKSRFNFTVQVKSIYTFNGKRDKHLLSKDFFNADKFPVMKFTSERIVHVKNEQYTVEGKMTIKDVTQPMKIAFQHFGPKQSPFEKGVMVNGFNASFALDRLDYHVGSGMFAQKGVVGKIVKIDISLETLNEK